MSSPHKPVKLLDASVIHRIAAGEVVDRPASILKELVENSLDAQSSRIKITLLDGGLKSIQVEDNGIGIPKLDLAQCVQRHATSKISQIDDLDAILSLGFRGEALSAAASVSQLIIETFTEVDGSWILEVVGGERKEIRPGTLKNGTKVSINDLFFNIPARRKFLKRPGAEAQECVDALEFLALAHPSISFEWYVLSDKGEIKSQRYLKGTSLAERFAEISGVKAEIIVIEKSDTENGFPKIEIAAAKAPAASPTQKSIRMSVNGRAILDKRLPYALREAYAGLIEIGAFPFVQVNLRVDPSLIDVNIHPQKKEIRWPQGVSVASKIYSLLRPQFEVKAQILPEFAPQSDLFTASSSDLLSTSGPEPSLSSVSSESSVLIAEAPTPFISDRSFPSGPLPAPASSSTPRIQLSLQSSRPPFKFSSLRVVGEVGAAWIVCESERGLVLIDQHAAHERVNFEKILSSDSLLRSRLMLVPLEIKIPYHLAHAKKEIQSALEALHFELSDESEKDTLEILAAPECDRKIVWGDIIESVFRALADDSSSERLLNEIKTRIAASLACHGSVRRGQRLGLESIAALLKQMDEVQWGGLCPHGRPLWFELPHLKIEELFHR